MSIFVSNETAKEDEKVRAIIQQLRKTYNDDGAQQFEFNASIYISGDSSANLRQRIVRLITGEDRAKSKCRFHAVVDMLKAHFQQAKLF